MYMCRKLRIANFSEHQSSEPSAMDDDDLDPADADALDDTAARAEKAAKVAQGQAVFLRGCGDGVSKHHGLVMVWDGYHKLFIQIFG